MHYQLFIPEVAGTGQQLLIKLGLGDFVPNHEAMNRPGPEGLNGTLIAWRKPQKNERMHFNESEQTWIPALPNGPDGAGKGRYWIGFWNDSPVTPDDLQRQGAVWGRVVALGDGQEWVVPAVESFTRDIVRMPESGEWHRPIQLRYHSAFFNAKLWWDKLKDMRESDVPWGEIAAYVESVLQLNYRLLPEVTDHLKLFNTDNLTAVMMAIIQAAAIEEKADVEQN